MRFSGMSSDENFLQVKCSINFSGIKKISAKNLIKIEYSLGSKMVAKSGID